LDNKINRAVLRYYDPSDKGAVTAFRDGNCVNDSGRFDATTNADATVPMQYNKAALETMHLANDMISSVMVPLGYQVVFFKTDGMQGE